MIKKSLTVFLLIAKLSCYSQSKEIVGAWHWQDSKSEISFFIKDDSTIEKRAGPKSEDIWNKAPKIGKYTFSNQTTLAITWSDKSTENARVKFIDDFSAEFQFSNSKSKAKKNYLFKRIVDEEVVPDK